MAACSVTEGCTPFTRQSPRGGMVVFIIFSLLWGSTGGLDVGWGHRGTGPRGCPALAKNSPGPDRQVEGLSAVRGPYSQRAHALVQVHTNTRLMSSDLDFSRLRGPRSRPSQLLRQFPSSCWGPRLTLLWLFLPTQTASQHKPQLLQVACPEHPGSAPSTPGHSAFHTPCTEAPQLRMGLAPHERTVS